MMQRIAPWALGGLLALSGAVRAEDSHDTVKPEDVKTWKATIDGKEYEVRPATVTDDGDDALDDGRPRTRGGA